MLFFSDIFNTFKEKEKEKTKTTTLMMMIITMMMMMIIDEVCMWAVIWKLENHSFYCEPRSRLEKEKRTVIEAEI